MCFCAGIGVNNDGVSDLNIDRLEHPLLLPPKFDSSPLKIVVFDPLSLINMRLPEAFLQKLLWWHVCNEV